MITLKLLKIPFNPNLNGVRYGYTSIDDITPEMWGPIIGHEYNIGYSIEELNDILNVLRYHIYVNIKIRQ